MNTMVNDLMKEEFEPFAHELATICINMHATQGTSDYGYWSDRYNRMAISFYQSTNETETCHAHIMSDEEVCFVSVGQYRYEFNAYDL